MAMENCIDVNASVVSRIDASINGSVHIGDSLKEGEEPDVDFLNEFDSYVEDIKDRLTISRMVNDSVIRGMVNAVEQEAADRIAQKELELVRLKKMMNSDHVCSDENKPLRPLMKHYEPNIEKAGVFSRLSDALFEHDRIQESLGSLKNAAIGQFENIRIEIDKIRGRSSIRGINSGSEWVGLGGILQEDETREWIDVDKTLDSLRITLDTVYDQVDGIIYSSRASLCQWQLEQEYQEEIEHMVVTNYVRSLKEQFEERLWDQNAQCYGNETVNWIEKINEISSLCKEFDAISKSLSNPETGLPNSHSSLEINDDFGNNKRTDYLHRKVSGNHVSSLASLSEANGKHEESIITVLENLDAAQPRDMSKEELVNYFKNEMTKMKINHDYKLQKMTEDFFIRRREDLNSFPSRKDKEFDVLRKKIPDVIVKLDRILVESENFLLLSNNDETLGNLKDRLEFLLSENRQLRDSLSDKEKEVNCLSSQVSDATVKMSQYSLAEVNLLKKVENLESAVEDAHLEATISGDVYKCFIGEAIHQIKRISEDSEMELNIVAEVYDLIFRDASCNMSHASKSEFEDSDLETLIMEGLSTVVFRETFSEAKEKLHDLSRNAFEKERVLNLMASVVDEKERLLNETVSALTREKEKFDMVRDQINRQQMIISKCNEESCVLKVNLSQALEKLELHKAETCELNRKLDQALKDLRESDGEKRRLLVAIKEKEDILYEQRKPMESIICLVDGLSTAIAGFECRVVEDLKRINLRLENLSSQSSSVSQMANILKRKGLQYKQILERRCSDLEKAENEVDLLGDEVEVLQGLLEKIYIALDHYSPILKHYPGIMEILKLVRRQLCGESTQSA